MIVWIKWYDESIFFWILIFLHNDQYEWDIWLTDFFDFLIFHITSFLLLPKEKQEHHLNSRTRLKQTFVIQGL